ncbi:hypothetical protein SAMN05216359_104320 [Roseateles sp. YR242]|uniref:hypothetical protein n=1 Tax=Roseateles sp. YR242 TaxID=1855305 RepID=UPI0008B7B530|nr:hypothetical protein [Roseateles sp. YR242]SEL01476.1 hypothetical protein SAMN05216359_104320 [Roseateles sp. YR242]
MSFVRTTGGLLQLNTKRLTKDDYLRAAAYARDVLKYPAISERIMAEQRKQGAQAPASLARTQTRAADAQAPVLEDLDAFEPELFR